MKSIIKFSDHSEDFALATGETASVTKDNWGFWNFETSSGYSTYELPEGFRTKAECVSELRRYEKNRMKE